MRTSFTLTIAALLALATGPVVARDDGALDGASAVQALNHPTRPGAGRANISRSTATWDAPAAAPKTKEWPTEEPTMLRTICTVFVPVTFMIGAAIFGLLFSFLSLRAQIREERVQYQPRGPE